MLISLTPNMTNPAGDAAAKSAEHPDSGSASGFFAQMDQILAPAGENREFRPPDKPGEQKSYPTPETPQNLMLGATMLSLNPIKAEPVLSSEMSIFASPASQDDEGSGGEVQASVCTVAPNGILNESGLAGNEVSVPDQHKKASDGIIGSKVTQTVMNWAQDWAEDAVQPKPVGDEGSDKTPETESAKGMMTKPGGKTDENISPPENPPANLKSISPDEIAGQQGTPAGPDQEDQEYQENTCIEHGTGSVVDWNSLKKFDAAREDLTTGKQDEGDQSPVSQKSKRVQSVENIQTASDKLAAATQSSNNRPAPLMVPQSPAEVELKTINDLQLPRAKAGQELSSESDRALRKEESHASGHSVPPQESRASEKTFQLAISRKTQDATSLASDTVGTGESPANQDAARYSQFSRPVMQGKPSNMSAAAFGRSQLDVAEHPMLTANPIRFTQSESPTGVPPASVSNPQSRELIFQLADQIQIQLRDGKGEIRIQLKPDVLGRIEINAAATINGVMARITTESHNVKAYLEHNLQLLQQTLNDQGLRVDRIQVVVQDALDSQTSSGYSSQFGHPGSGRSWRNTDAFSEASEPLPMGPVEEITVDPLSWLALNPNSRFHTVA
jgi:flagellar hook-length control protein FliK